MARQFLKKAWQMVGHFNARVTLGLNQWSILLAYPLTARNSHEAPKGKAETLLAQPFPRQVIRKSSKARNVVREFCTDMRL